MLSVKHSQLSVSSTEEEISSVTTTSDDEDQVQKLDQQRSFDEQPAIESVSVETCSNISENPPNQQDINTDNTAETPRFHKVRGCILLASALIIVMVGILAVTSLLPPPEQPGSGNTTLRLISRAEWRAKPPKMQLKDLQLPAKRIIIAHTDTPECETMEICSASVRSIQEYHMEDRDFGDIGYNFLVGGDGSAYEGRGWSKIGAHTKGHNEGSICIAFIGNFQKKSPPEDQLLAAEELIAWGLEEGKLSKDYRLFGHLQLIATESPGAALYRIITAWPHWSSGE
ncbi:peptidoglycan-recognition protein SD-like [Phlebotomus argentipes]|uniref:peptidoglycan-recognition protein SD-like n=1 Tax=Phlebotomus argentipes TaxID=94469 RepID=UPI002892FA27|nr:peptidoglycan-recognition protein SD-like [Phlebotomus argentipes]